MKTIQKPVKKAAIKKQAAKKSAAKKGAAKKSSVSSKEKDEKGKKISTLKFDVYENGILVNGEAGIKSLISIAGTVERMIINAVMPGLVEGKNPRDVFKKKAPAKKK